MKKFVFKLSAFALAVAALYLLLLLLLPATPHAMKSMFAAEIKKDSLLIHETSPRIIFIGGSNVSFGLNSQMIKDSLGLNPINAAIHASLGLKYMLDNSIRYIKKGDIVVLMPEYQQFYNEYDNFGSEELMRMVIDVDKSKIRLLSLGQLFQSLKFSGNIFLSRFSPKEYLDAGMIEFYNVDSFNQYGDACEHWGKPNKDFSTLGATDTSKYKPEAMSAVKKYESEIRQKGATLFVAYPGLQNLSFHNMKEEINKIEREFKKNRFAILGTPKRYMIPDSLMFDTSYHLSKEGTDYRTRLLISDLKLAIGGKR